MSAHSLAWKEITFRLPESIYERIRLAAERLRRPVDDVIAEAVSAAAPALENTAEPLRRSLSQMAYLNDAALWQAARATMPKELRERLSDLHDKQKQTALSAAEVSEEQSLLSLYRETVLVRAQAAVLLKQRGYDIADMSQFAPLE
jgi:predicted DNA-binding protein